MSNVTPEQMQAIGDHLREAPRSWRQLHWTRRNTLIEALRPHPITGFDPIQYGWLSGWLLEITPEQLATLQANTPNQYVPIKATDGTLYLSASLLTDALDGRRLSADLPILDTLPMIDRSTITFPEPETEDEE